MEHKFNKAKTQRYEKTNTTTFCTSLFVCLMVFMSGCENPMQMLSNDSDINDKKTLREQSLRILQQGLADNDALVRARTIEVVASTQQLRLMPTVHRLLQDEVVPVRFAAVLAVGDLEYAPAEKLVKQLLKDPDMNVVIAAAYAMSRLGSIEYLEVFQKAIKSNDQTVRANAALILGKIRSNSSLELLKIVQEDEESSDKVRFQVLEARAKLGDEEVLQKLWAIIYSAYADDRIMGIRAMGALGVLGTPKIKDILITKLDDDIVEVRLAVAEQLGRLGNNTGAPEVLDVFTKKLNTGPDKQANERINVLTAMAIGQICTPSLTKHLPELLRNESKFVRIAAANAVLQCIK
jgi:HEAT repeat protein